MNTYIYIYENETFQKEGRQGQGAGQGLSFWPGIWAQIYRKWERESMKYLKEEYPRQ